MDTTVIVDAVDGENCFIFMKNSHKKVHWAFRSMNFFYLNDLR